VAGLFLTRGHTPQAQAIVARAEAQFAASGLSHPTALALPGWQVRHWGYAKGGPDTLLIEGEDFAAVAGTMTVDGLMGREALARLITMMADGAIDWQRVAGQFVALVRSAGRTWLFTDFFAAFQLFRSEGDTVLSTSMLAALDALPLVRFDAQGVYEFAFNVVPIGDDTVFEKLKLLGSATLLELTEDGTKAHPLAKPLPDRTDDRPLTERMAIHRDLLGATVDDHVRAFGNAIHCPLSGGLDSRLLLGAFRASGAAPHVYVYGPATSEDVRIARTIAAAEGFAIEWIDKEAAPLPPDAFAEQVAANFAGFDALPTFGNIFDNGGHLAARDHRHPAGGLAASGGCGEVYRDFFYMADRPSSADAVARTFFARFVASDATDAFDPHGFVARIAAKLSEAAESEDGRLTRTQVEQLYPRIRCRSLFGREISLEARLGAYFMPFLDHRIVAEALTLPMPMKQAGRFEGALLNAIDPALARHPSTYGHDFKAGPNRAHRFAEWTTRIRPAWLRQQSYALQRRRGPMGDEHGGLLDADYMGRVIDLEFPAMRRFFDVGAIADSAVWRRVACLEYLAGRLGSKLG
jgi:hypothetical protein